MKKVGKTTRPLRCDLNQIPYNYTVEVGNRFKGPNLIGRVSDELWKEAHDIVQETGIKTIPKKKKCKKEKWVSEEDLQIAVKGRETQEATRLSEDALQRAEKRKEAKGKGKKERCTHLNAEFQRIARRDKKTFLTDQCKEIEENNRMGKTRDL